VVDRPRMWRLADCRGSGAVAQLGERLNGIQEVRGSIPLGSTGEGTARAPVAQLDRASDFGSEGREFESLRAHLEGKGGVPERPNGADCKSAGLCLRRFESYPHHCARKRANYEC
jgi:hypothetical protein